MPPGAASLDEANAAIELWEHYSGKRLDSTQRLTVQVMMAQADDGSWAASTTGREMPRQGGKGDEVEVVELWGLVQRSEAILHTVHDAVLLASQTQQRMLGVIDGHADLRRLKQRAWLGTGQQMIEMRNGGVIWYRTRTGGGGRGVDDIDRLVIDEAQHANEEHLAAMTPTLLANANPQMNVLGTSGLEGRSEWWWTVRIRALSPSPGRFGYVGHTVEDVSVRDGRVMQSPVDATNEALWPLANPTLAAGRGTGIEFFREQLQRLGPRSFAREHLGVWAPPPMSVTGGVIDDAAWVTCLDPSSQPVEALQWALVVSPDRKRATFGMAGRRSDGRTHVEMIDSQTGTAWVVAAAQQLAGKFTAPLRIHKSGPEAAYLDPLRAAGVEVVEVSSGEVAQATGQMIDAANGNLLRHLGQAALDVALRGAVLRESSDGAVIWSQRSSQTEITPLMACTVALGGVPQTAPQFDGDWLVALDDIDVEVNG